MAFAAKLREQVQYATKDNHKHVTDAKAGAKSRMSSVSTICGEDDIWTRTMCVQSRRPSETTSISSTTCGEDDLRTRWNSPRQPTKHDPLQFRTLMLLPSIDQIFPNGFDDDEDEASDTDSSVDAEDTWSLEGDLESRAPAKSSRVPSELDENDATDQANWCDDWSDCSDLSDGSIEFIDVLHPTAMMDLPEISDLESDFSTGSTFVSESPN